MTEIYHRRQEAEELAERLIHPSSLGSLRSGLFFSGPRRTGKSTFLKKDLIPALERHGALVIYVDLWAKNHMPDKAEVILDAIREKLKVPKVGEDVSLADAFTEVVDKTKADVVLIVDEVQACRDMGLMRALKATRDAINIGSHYSGHFLFIGAGSDRERVTEMTKLRQEPFYGARSFVYPMLDEGFVTWALNDKSVAIKPSLAAAVEAFKMLDYQPETFMDALKAMNRSVERSEQADDMLRMGVWMQRKPLWEPK